MRTKQKAHSMNTTHTAATVAAQIADAIQTLEQLADTLEQNPSATAAQLALLCTARNDSTWHQLARGVSYAVRTVNIYAERIAAQDEAQLYVYYDAIIPRTPDSGHGSVTFRLRNGHPIYVCHRTPPAWWNGKKFAPISAGALDAIENHIHETIVNTTTSNADPHTVAAMIQDAQTDARRTRATSALAQARHKLEDVARGIDR